MSHRGNNRLIQWLACMLFLVTLSATAAYETEEPVDFSLHQLGGGEVSLSDYRGGWVLIVLGLAFEDTDDSAFEEFLAEFHASYPILRVDVYEPPEPFGAPKVLPTTIILDAEGRAVKAFLGPVTREAIERYIDSAAASDGKSVQ